VDAQKPRIKRKPNDIRWCGDLRTVLDRGPFDPQPETSPNDEHPSSPTPTESAA
jgi:hypothetical protein